jgi:ribonuclease HI
VFDENKQLTFLSDCDPEYKNAVECQSTKASIWRMSIDGASRNNPGKAGAGFCLQRADMVECEQGFYVGQRTNNQAEYFALLLGLFCAKEYVKEGESLLIFSDSQLLVRQMSGIYKIKDPVLIQMKNLAQHLFKSYKVTFCHVYREHNVRADFLANRGIDKMTLMPKKFTDLLEKHDIA